MDPDLREARGDVRSRPVAQVQAQVCEVEPVALAAQAALGARARGQRRGPVCRLLAQRLGPVPAQELQRHGLLVHPRGHQARPVGVAILVEPDGILEPPEVPVELTAQPTHRDLVGSPVFLEPQQPGRQARMHAAVGGFECRLPDVDSICRLAAIVHELDAQPLRQPPRNRGIGRARLTGDRGGELDPCGLERQRYQPRVQATSEITDHAPAPQGSHRNLEGIQEHCCRGRGGLPPELILIGRSHLEFADFLRHPCSRRQGQDAGMDGTIVEDPVAQKRGTHCRIGEQAIVLG